MWPFEPYKIDSEFNQQVSYGPHEGLDLNGIHGGNTDCGYEIRCIYPGKVVHSFDAKHNYGNLVVVESNTPNGKRWTRYCHLDERRINSGFLRRGEIVGTMGSTGNSTACHLHLDVLKKKPDSWRFYTKNILEWFVDPRELIEADIIESDMPDYLKGLLNDQLDIDITESEGDVRGRVGEIVDKLRNYENLQKQVTKLEKENIGLEGQVGQLEREFQALSESRDRITGEIEQVKKELIETQAKLTKRDELIDAQNKRISALEEAMNPETTVILKKEEYDRLIKRKRTDRLTDRELLGAWFERKWEAFKNIFKRGE